MITKHRAATAKNQDEADTLGAFVALGGNVSMCCQGDRHMHDMCQLGYVACADMAMISNPLLQLATCSVRCCEQVEVL